MLIDFNAGAASATAIFCVCLQQQPLLLSADFSDFVPLTDQTVSPSSVCTCGIRTTTSSGLLISRLSIAIHGIADTFFTFCHYRTEYRDSFILLVSREYRRSFFTI